MGRRRARDPELPVRMQFSHGAYFHVDGRERTKAKWTRLGVDRDAALKMYQRIESGVAHDEVGAVVRHIRPLEALRSLPDARSIDGPGVYFLWQGEALHYVGRSKNVRNRVRYHRTPKMGIPHDLATAMACDKFASLVVEAVHIDFYRPAGNELLV